MNLPAFLSGFSALVMNTQQFQDLDRKFLWHPFTHMRQWMNEDPLVIVAGEGCELIDSEGKRYLDGVSSLWCNVHGHRVKEIDDAIKKQLDRIAHTTLLGLTNDVAAELAQRLVQITPRGLNKVFFGSDGASATEIAFKMAVQYWWNQGQPEKREFIGLVDAYHGDTVGGMSVGRSPAFQRPFAPLLFKTYESPAPHEYRGITGGAALNAMARILEKHSSTIAAICVEPMVMGAAGMIVQPTGFLKGVRALATEYDVLLICDEVATGFGRTGKMFACEHEEIRPDLMCLGKGITGGYLPLSATLATDAIFDTFLGETWEGKTFFHGHTFTGNPLACAAALASIELFDTNNLVQKAHQSATYLQRRLQRLHALPHVGDIRQCGLMVGVELVADKKTKQPFDPRSRIGAMVCKNLREQGIILRPLGDTIVIMPPLVIELGQLQRIVDTLGQEIAKLRDLPGGNVDDDQRIAGDF